MAYRARAAVVLVGIVLTACRAEERAAPEATHAPAAPAAETARLPFALTEAQAEGKLIFEAMCWTCHGPSGHGDGPAVQAGSVPAPPDFTTGAYPRLTADQLQARFSQAQAAGRHPNIQFIQSMLQPDVFAKALAYIPALGYPPEIQGSAIAGSQTYALRCVGCHGLDGDGRGPAAAQLTVQPADFTQDTLIQRRDFEALFRRAKEGGGAVHGSSMPPWGVLLSDTQIWDLVAYIATFQPGAVSEPPAPKPGS